ncbi:thiamine biosynthesis lipoprotein [Okibacterium sp. HSC-33S16]|uniref:FAD:protein FMN transferase n=1 Tax=Okibacterium sp. HSC-33S16 TaxID=2910965 RepID=UPI0020A0AF2D|nr:FAD:protein FMN transferase [Okibacterium sp. HSC-33S16]MCP2031746.1 thiamine biosynthesis lipoprotein [Okibacterium sp. HSC-33S16]
MPTEPGTGTAALTADARTATWSFEAIGTAWQIDTAEPVAALTRAAIDELIEVFEGTWSRFRSDSVVTAAARSAGRFDCGADAPALFSLYRRLGDVTGGAVSPFVGDALDALGYDADYSFRPHGTAGPAPREDEVGRLDGTILTTVRQVTIDVGAAGKGYLVDRVAGLLRAAGHASFTVDASGDLLHAGDPIRVALEHPFDPTLAIGVTTLRSGALCASASNRRAWGSGLHHVIDGRTGRPTSTVVATWATAPDAALADGAATALFFTSPAELSSTLGIDGLRMFSDGTAERSVGFDAELFR